MNSNDINLLNGKISIMDRINNINNNMRSYVTEIILLLTVINDIDDNCSGHITTDIND